MFSPKNTIQICIIIIVVIISFSIFQSLRSYKLEADLKAENNYVLGEIVDHYYPGTSKAHFIKFQYYVDGEMFKKTSYYGGNFRSYHKTRNCIGQKYFVFYRKGNPEIAFMDFEMNK